MCSLKHCSSYCTIAWKLSQGIQAGFAGVAWQGRMHSAKHSCFIFRTKDAMKLYKGPGRVLTETLHMCVWFLNSFLVTMGLWPLVELITPYEDVTRSQEFSNKPWDNDFCKGVWDCTGGMLQKEPEKWKTARFWGWGIHGRGVRTFPLVFLSSGFLLLVVASWCPLLLLVLVTFLIAVFKYLKRSIWRKQ